GVADPRAVLQLQVETGRIAELEGGRWREADDHRLLRAAEVFGEPIGDCLHLVVGAAPLIPGFELDEGEPSILSVPAEAEASDLQHPIDRLPLVLEQVPRDLI